MKRIKVGRSRECDVIIPDNYDRVSRQHLVITFDPLGRMTVSDTSSNGTTVNDKPLTKGVSMPVTRNDKVLMGGEALLDWNQVRDPYRGLRKASIAFLAAALVIGIGTTVFYAYFHDRGNEDVKVVVTDREDTNGEWTADSTMKVAPKANTVDLAGDEKAAQNPAQPSAQKAQNKPTSKSSKKATSKPGKKDNKTQNRPQPLSSEKAGEKRTTHPETEPRGVVNQREYNESLRKANPSTTNEKD